MSGGWNPMTGRDSTGTLPAFSPAGGPVPTQVPQQAYVALSAMSQLLPVQMPNAGFQTPLTFAVQPNGTGNVLPRQPQPVPNIDPSMPAAQMTNSSGGVGCEPGYNYFFPPEHTKMHIFKSELPPWTLPTNAQIPFMASHVPCHITFAELLAGFGCTNPTPKKNKCFEITNGGNGKWYKGWSFGGEDKDTLKMTLKEVGWDKTRSGLPNEKPVVCVWFCRS